MRCVLSVDQKIENLFIVNNGNDPGVLDATNRIKAREIPNQQLFTNIRIEKQDHLGCGPSWNRFIRTSPGAWMISANDIQFAPGSVGRIKKVVYDNQDASIVCAFGYNVFVFTDVGKAKVGLFDENFYPAYFEDCDHFRRVALSGAKAVAVPGFECIHGEAPYWGSSTVHSDPELARRNGITFGNLRKYYANKWGGEPGKESFMRPFNQSVPLDYWEIDPDLRKRNAIW